MNRPFLSMVIPVYKIKESYLRQCLDSLREQTVQNFEAILIDDGSPDGCGSICDEYARNSSLFSVIHQTNKGVSEARNAGMRAAAGDWIVFIDPDDWVEKRYVEILSQAADRTGADIIFFDYYNEFPEVSVQKCLKNTPGFLDDEWIKGLRIAPFNIFTVKNRMIRYETNTIWSKVFRAGLLREHDLWFEPEARKGQDTIFVSEILQCASSMYYVNRALYHYRHLDSPVTNAYNPKVMYYNEIMFRCQENIIEKYDLPGEYKEALQAHICTRMYSGMRLYYFNERNPADYQMVKREILDALNREPYKAAFQNVNYKMLSGEQRIFVFFLKHHKIAVVRILVKARRKIKRTG